MIHVITTFDVSERSACRLVGLPRSAFRRPLKADTPDDPDRALRAWLRDYSRRHARWGYRRTYVDARRDGWQVNHKKIQRLWTEEGPRVVVKRRRKRIGVSTVPAVVAGRAGDVWSVDFQFDSTITGKPVKILSIVDEHTRECLGGIVDYSITGLDLAEQLDVLAIDRGMPQALRMDNGPELISNAVAEWASETERVFIPPGQPWRNGYVESFNGKLRDECLNVNQFYSLNHAKGIIGIWKEEYNTIRPHSSLGYSTSSVYAGQCTHQKPVATLEATGPKTGGRSDERKTTALFKMNCRPIAEADVTINLLQSLILY